MKKLMFYLITLSTVAVACSKGGSTEAQVDCTGEAKSFTTDINPIIQASCTSSGCHGNGSRNGPGALTSYQEIFNARSSIRSAVASGSMPQGGSLPSSQVNAILCWIDNGATNN